MDQLIKAVNEANEAALKHFDELVSMQRDLAHRYGERKQFKDQKREVNQKHKIFYTAFFHFRELDKRLKREINKMEVKLEGTANA